MKVHKNLDDIPEGVAPDNLLICEIGGELRLVELDEKVTEQAVRIWLEKEVAQWEPSFRVLGPYTAGLEPVESTESSAESAGAASPGTGKRRGRPRKEDTQAQTANTANTENSQPAWLDQ